MRGLSARRRIARRLRALLVLGIVALTAGMLANTLRYRGQDNSRTSATPSEIAISLAHGVAWIWPDSNGPNGSAAVRYRDAAVLVESLVLRGGRVEHGGRTQSLRLPAGVRLVPVVHVEAGADVPSELTSEQRAAVVAAVRRQAGAAATGAGVLQLDFEAPARARDAYRGLVAEVRHALPAGVRLSVTALAHWCAQGDWLDHLPVDEVVPMLYRLGPHADVWRRRFAQDDSGLALRCRGPALGFATNDPPSPALLARAVRPYWFDENAWSNPSRPPRHLAP